MDILIGGHGISINFSVDIAKSINDIMDVLAKAGI